MIVVLERLPASTSIPQRGIHEQLLQAPEPLKHRPRLSSCEAEVRQVDTEAWEAALPLGEVGPEGGKLWSFT
ncbi:MAG: hypothetical protein QXF90_09335 [Thermofilaceae archaeon]